MKYFLVTLTLALVSCGEQLHNRKATEPHAVANQTAEESSPASTADENVMLTSESLAQRTRLGEQASALIEKMEQNKNILIYLKTNLASPEVDAAASQNYLELISTVGKALEEDTATLNALLAAYDELPDTQDPDAQAAGLSLWGGGGLLAGLIGAVANTVGTAATGVVGAVGAVVGGAAQVAQTVAVTAVSTVGQVVGDAALVAGALAGTAVNTAGAVVGGVAGVAGAVMSTAANTAGQVVGGAALVAEALASTAVNTAGAVVGGAAGVAGVVASTAVNTAGGVVGGLAAILANGAQDAAINAHRAVSGVLAGIQGRVCNGNDCPLSVQLGVIPFDSAANPLKLVGNAIDNLLIGLQTGIYFLTAIPSHNGNNDAHKIPIFDNVVIYDNSAQNLETLPPGVVRLSNAKYAKMLSLQELNDLGSDLRLNLTLQAECATYDGGGFFSLALVPKGYGPDSLENKNIKRIEVGRFMTPFMNKNRKPDQVPYSYSIGHLARTLRDPEFNGLYDFWLELEVGVGIGDAANQVSGCKDNHEGFRATVAFATNSRFLPAGKSIIIPIDYTTNLNSSDQTLTDEVGKVVRTISFNVDKPISNASFFLITTKHGSESGGEEYIRRVHNVSMDDKQILQYTPGGDFCEPYRIYNTMSNGIYGPFPKLDWIIWSNWCPGAAVPTRQITVGDLAPGNHTFRLAVPEMTSKGAVLMSAYLQGEVK